MDGARLGQYDAPTRVLLSVNVDCLADTYPTLHRDPLNDAYSQEFVKRSPRFMKQLMAIHVSMRDLGLSLEQVKPALRLLAARKNKQRQEKLRLKEKVQRALQMLAAEKKHLAYMRLAMDGARLGQYDAPTRVLLSVNVDCLADTYPTLHRDPLNDAYSQEFVKRSPRFMKQLMAIHVSMRDLGLSLEQVKPALRLLAARKNKQRQEKLRLKEKVQRALQMLAAEKKHKEEEQERLLAANFELRQKRANMHVVGRELPVAKRKCVPLPSV